ncbi:hypothetical protein HBO18_30035 [Pseudomonas lactis]|uniref:Uncharacterized protein n=1 Tax=Pseudomonas lactis TaxID=1615674 RepID=A0A7Y1LLI4_9PSED|nr:hypothetical protein [Pseudomonas lactis]NNA48360.1 hypothetical protein [Pseudomonas lactis]
MSNRSKKVVLSARVAPHLKDGLELYARVKNIKIVEAVEELIERALEEVNIESPLRSTSGDRSKVPVSTIISWLWDPDPIIFKLRLANVSPDLVDKETYLAYVETTSDRFKGDVDIFEDVRKRATYRDVYHKASINLERVREEWADLVAYAKFIEANKPIVVDYEDWLRMIRPEA